jgi:8-oxo-dGTP diphosphatase
MSNFARCASSTARNTPVPEPRVGVGVVILRHLKECQEPEVLLIRRGKPPNKGLWSFCGGRLELGETIVQCAAREAKEETGSVLLQESSSSLFETDLRYPVPFTAADVIERDESGIRFHYAVIEVASRVENPRIEPVSGDDADEAKWFSISAAKVLGEELVPKGKEVIQEALNRFSPLPRE